MRRLVAETLGKLRAPGGVYYVRGNHDRRVRQEQLVRMLSGLGIVHLGGVWREIVGARHADCIGRQ